jgi:putative transposase
MAEVFVRTLKRDYVRVAEKPNARAVINQLETSKNRLFSA